METIAKYIKEEEAYFIFVGEDQIGGPIKNKKDALIIGKWINGALQSIPIEGNNKEIPKDQDVKEVLITAFNYIQEALQDCIKYEVTPKELMIKINNMIIKIVEYISDEKTKITKS